MFYVSSCGSKFNDWAILSYILANFTSAANRAKGCNFLCGSSSKVARFNPAHVWKAPTNFLLPSRHGAYLAIPIFVLCIQPVNRCHRCFIDCRERPPVAI